MAIDLKNLTPTTVSRDLKGKFIFLYGAPKIGKTTLAVQFPKNLLLGFEHGWNVIDGVYAIDVPTWGEFKKYIKQLSEPSIQETFSTVTIDTIGLAYERCEAYICDREGVDKLGDVPFGAAYKMVDKEFEECIRKITQLGYGLCLIGHEKTRIDSDGQISIKHIVPDVSDRCSKIINRMVDLTAYIGEEDGVRYIYPRQTRIEKDRQVTDIYAGSHFANLNDKIELGYESLVNAIADAMTTNGDGKVVKLVDTPVQVQQDLDIDFNAVKTSIGKIARQLSKLDEELETPHYMADYKSMVDRYLGKNKLVRDCTETQAEHLLGILEELQAYVSENKIEIK